MVSNKIVKLRVTGKKESKNNISNRGKSSELKKIDGKFVKPIMYIGDRLGHGKYMAANFMDGTIIKDKNGKPVPYKEI